MIRTVPGMAADSRLMRLLTTIGAPRLAWAARRLHVPVSSSALVLDVGSGGNPYPRADVLCDAYWTSSERHWEPLRRDRPTVLGRAERLPFRDKAFDFVVASHVLEHSPDPERFLAELQRVGSAGYIETPHAFLEQVSPYLAHRLEVGLDDEGLVLTRKANARARPEVADAYSRSLNTIPEWPSFLSRHAAAFHVRFYWRDEIRSRTTNPEVPIGWEPDDAAYRMGQPPGAVRRLLTATIARAAARRGRAFRLLDLLQCPACQSTALQEQAGRVTCAGCQRTYEVRDGVPILMA